MSQSRALAPIDEIRASLVRLQPEFASALPSHISPDKFQRVVITAINSTPDLVDSATDRHSLYAACMKCAQDGLLPDGREAALVKYGNKIQYMPMVGGILKKIRNSGEIATICAHVVYEADEFDHFTDDTGEHFHHRADYFAADRGKARGVFAMAITKDGHTYFEPMSTADVEKVRSVSKAKNATPWTLWWDEKAKVAALKRLSKRLPMSTDLEQVLKHDNEEYEPDAGEAGNTAAATSPAAPAAEQPTRTGGRRRPRGLQRAMDNANAGGTQETGEVIDVDHSEVKDPPADRSDDPPI